MWRPCDPESLGAGHDTTDWVLCKYSGSIRNTFRILTKKYGDSMLTSDKHTIRPVFSEYGDSTINGLSEIRQNTSTILLK